MLGFLQNRKKEDGFTLIELMVVVLIIAILVAIAVPTFLGARGSSQDRQAQSDLRNALSAAKVIYTDTESYAMTLAGLQGVEPSLTWSVTADAADENTVEVVSDASNFLALTASEGGDYFAIYTTESGTTGSCSGTEDAVDSVSECTALNATTGWAG